MTDDDEVNEAQAARLMGWSESTMRRYRRAGHVAYYRTPGGRVRFRGADLMELRLRMRVEAKPDPI